MTGYWGFSRNAAIVPSTQVAPGTSESSEQLLFDIHTHVTLLSTSEAAKWLANPDVLKGIEKTEWYKAWREQNPKGSLIQLMTEPTTVP